MEIFVGSESYIETCATGKIPCAWKCVFCETVNADIAVITSSVTRPIGWLSNKKNDTAGKEDEKAACEQVDQYIHYVNHQHNLPYRVYIKGICQRCEKLQPWAADNEHAALRSFIGIAAGLAVCATPIMLSVFHPSYGKLSGYFQLIMILVGFLAGIIARLGAIDAVRSIQKRIAFGKVKRCINLNYYFPVVLDEKEIDNLDMSDDRHRLISFFYLRLLESRRKQKTDTDSK